MLNILPVPEIVCRPGALRDLPARLRRLECSRPLVITDPGVRAAGLVDRLVQVLQDAGLPHALFAEVEADPPSRVVEAAVAFGRDHHVDGVIGFGGGSSLDVAKVAALLLRSPQPLASIFGNGKAIGPRLPLIQIPTTAGTGSEVTPTSVISVGAFDKRGVISRTLICDDALLDPELTVGLPASVTAATGMDALTHAIEALTTRHLRNAISDALALKAIALIGRHIHRAVTDGRDLEARTAMMEGATMAGMAFANAPVGAVHALAHPLGDSRFKVPHGLANALLLPHVIRFNMPDAELEYAQVSRALGWDGDGRDLPARLIDLNARLNLPANLQTIGIAAADLPILVEEGMKVDRLLANNIRPVTIEDARAVFQNAWQ